MKTTTCKNPADISSVTSSKAKNVVLSKWRRCVQVVQVRSEHTAFIPWHLHLFFFSFWHLPKVLIRKSAIRACSGASTLKDQYLGQVPGGRKKKKAETRFGQSCWRGTRGPRESAIVLPYRDPKNYASTCPHGYTILRKTLWCRGQAPMNRDRLRKVLRGVHIHGSEVKR